MDRLVASTSPIPEEGVAALRDAGASLEVMGRNVDPAAWLKDAVSRAEVLLLGFHRLGSDILGGAENLRLIVAMSSGVDHIDVETAAEMGICVANQPEAIAEAVAEHAIAMILAALRRLVEGRGYAAEGGWLRERGYLRGRTLKGKTIGVVGMGRIGSLVAFKARLLGVSRVLYWSRRRKREVEQILHAEPSSMERLFAESDVIVVALPASRDTEGIIGWDLLARMKEGAVLVNVGRGSVVDEQALVKLVRERSDVVVALDVFREEPLPPENPIAVEARRNPRVLLTPHIAGGSDISLWATRYLAALQAATFLRSGEVWNPVAGPCKEARDIKGLWSPLGAWPP